MQLSRRASRSFRIIGVAFLSRVPKRAISATKYADTEYQRFSAAYFRVHLEERNARALDVSLSKITREQGSITYTAVGRHAELTTTSFPLTPICRRKSASPDTSATIAVFLLLLLLHCCAAPVCCCRWRGGGVVCATGRIFGYPVLAPATTMPLTPSEVDQGTVLPSCIRGDTPAVVEGLLLSVLRKQEGENVAADLAAGFWREKVALKRSISVSNDVRHKVSVGSTTFARCGFSATSER